MQTWLWDGVKAQPVAIPWTTTTVWDISSVSNLYSSKGERNIPVFISLWANLSVDVSLKKSPGVLTAISVAVSDSLEG